MIYVCDAIMGAGKSSAAINYMNERPHQKFIYVTPFKEETQRIRDACPELRFWTPANIEEYEFQKREHFKYLVGAGLNIATTHVLFSLCDDEAIELIRQKEYTIIIDEAITAMDRMPAKADDVKMAMASDWFQCDNCDDGQVHEVTVSDAKYDGDWLKDIRFYAKSHRLVALKDDDGAHRLYCWMFNTDLFYVAKDTFVLTYLFDSSPMSYLFQMNQIEYEPMYVDQDGSGRYIFSTESKHMPDYTKHLKDMIHILHNDKMNAIGASKGSLSITWSKNAAKRPSNNHADELRKNLYNYFRNIHKDDATNPKDRLWTCHGALEAHLKGKGYTNRHLVFNSRATNEYREAYVLAYCANVYMPVWEQKYYEQEGVDVDANLYALSTLIQWIWRSAIRDGKEIWIYIPSKRMRTLLEDWIDQVVEEATTLEITPAHKAEKEANHEV